MPYYLGFSAPGIPDAPRDASAAAVVASRAARTVCLSSQWKRQTLQGCRYLEMLTSLSFRQLSER